MSQGLPNCKVEINWSGSTWTDVSTDHDLSSEMQIHVGRTDPYQDVAAATLTLRLSNPLGKYSPFRQVLTDGTVNPYYPNVVLRKLIRVSYTVAGTPYYRFWGPIKGLTPGLEGGTRPYVDISAVCSLEQLGRTTLLPGTLQAIVADSPTYLWPFTDTAGYTASGELISNVTALKFDGGFNPVMTYGTGPATPLSDGLTGLTVSSTGATSVVGGGWTTAMFYPSTAANTNWSFGQWVTLTPDSAGVYPGFVTTMVNPNAGGAFISIGADPPGTAGTPPTGFVQVGFGGYFVSFNPFTVTDGGAHLYAVTGSDSGGTLTIKTYVDGVLVDTRTLTGGTGNLSGGVYFTGYATTALGYLPNMPQVTFGPAFLTESTVTQSQAQLYYAGGAGGAGYTTSQRVAEYLRWAGFTSANWNLDTGVETVGSQPTNGRTILALCQDMATTEGGGSVIYCTPTDGKFRFTSRTYRNPAAAKFTVDAQKDLDNTIYQPQYDDAQLVNQVSVSRMTGAGAATTQVASDAESIAASQGTFADSLTSYAATDTAALFAAQERIAARRTPGWRVPRIGVNLATANTALYDKIATTQVGDRVTLSNIPEAALAPAIQVDGIVEGWTESMLVQNGDAYYRWIGDLSPADSPRRAVWGSFKYQCDGQTLSTTISSTATTTVVIATAANKPTFTTTPGAYPLDITIDAEDITLTSAPSGSTSPQTFTGCTRGANGTTKSPSHTSGAPVTLKPRATYTL